MIIRPEHRARMERAVRDLIVPRIPTDFRPRPDNARDQDGLIMPVPESVREPDTRISGCPPETGISVRDLIVCLNAVLCALS